LNLLWGAPFYTKKAGLFARLFYFVLSGYKIPPSARRLGAGRNLSGLHLEPGAVGATTCNLTISAPIETSLTEKKYIRVAISSVIRQ
jgi:hypothetical protein